GVARDPMASRARPAVLALGRIRTSGQTVGRARFEARTAHASSNRFHAYDTQVVYPGKGEKPMSNPVLLSGKWSYPTTVWAGPERISELPQACAALGMKRPLFVTDSGLKSTA